MPDRFIEQARAAFEPLAEAAGLEFEGQSEEEWFAWVKWSRGGITLRVSDDRRDRLIEVVILRPTTDDDDRAALSELMRGTELALPLWAVVESRGGVTDYDVSGDRRLERLPMYAEAVHTYGMEFLADPRTSVDAVVRVVRERNWEWSEEGRKAKRFLP
jgi:hypothetical protein